MFLKGFLTQIYYHMEHNKIISINIQSIVNIFAVYYKFIYNKLYYILYTYTFLYLMIQIFISFPLVYYYFVTLYNIIL